MKILNAPGVRDFLNTSSGTFNFLHQVLQKIFLKHYQGRKILLASGVTKGFFEILAMKKDFSCASGVTEIFSTLGDEDSSCMISCYGDVLNTTNGTVVLHDQFLYRVFEHYRWNIFLAWSVLIESFWKLAMEYSSCMIRCSRGHETSYSSTEDTKKNV